MNISMNYIKVQFPDTRVNNICRSTDPDLPRLWVGELKWSHPLNPIKNNKQNERKSNSLKDGIKIWMASRCWYYLSVLSGQTHCLTEMCRRYENGFIAKMCRSGSPYRSPLSRLASAGLPLNIKDRRMWVSESWSCHHRGDN